MSLSGASNLPPKSTYNPTLHKADGLDKKVETGETKGTEKTGATQESPPPTSLKVDDNFVVDQRLGQEKTLEKREPDASVKQEKVSKEFRGQLGGLLGKRLGEPPTSKKSGGPESVKEKELEHVGTSSAPTLKGEVGSLDGQMRNLFFSEQGNTAMAELLLQRNKGDATKAIDEAKRVYLAKPEDATNLKLNFNTTMMQIQQQAKRGVGVPVQKEVETPKPTFEDLLKKPDKSMKDLAEFLLVSNGGDPDKAKRELMFLNTDRHADLVKFDGFMTKATNELMQEMAAQGVGKGSSTTTVTAPVKQPPIMTSSMSFEPKARGIDKQDPPTVLESKAQIFEVAKQGGPIPKVLSELLDRDTKLSGIPSVIDDYRNGGVHVRKIGGPGVTSNPVTDDLNHMSKNSPGGANESQPIVRPSTFVMEGVPVNLTDAGGNIAESSGLMFSQKTQLAPSTKEHSKSVRLGGVMGDLKGLSGDEWRGIMRKTVEEKGGRSFDDAKGLGMKMREMNDRRLGNIPDLSSSELLVDLMAFGKKQGLVKPEDPIAKGTFDKLLDAYQHKNPDTQQSLPLPDYVKQNLRDTLGVAMEDKGYKTFGEADKGLTEKVTGREQRDHSIYTQQGVQHTTNFDGFKPAARYFLPRAEREKRTSDSKGEGYYDGTSFRTSEALMLPTDKDVGAVYVNTRSAESILQAMYIGNEFHAQSGRTLPFVTYDPHEGMKRVTVDSMLDLMKDRLQSQPTKSVGSTKTEPKGVEAVEKNLNRYLSAEERAGTQKLKKEEIVELANNKHFHTDDPALPPGLGKQVADMRLDLLMEKRSQVGEKPEGTPARKRKPEETKL